MSCKNSGVFGAIQGNGSHGHPAGPEPKEVRLSFFLWLAGAILLVVSSVLVLTQRDLALEEARKAPPTPGVTTEQLESAVTAVLMIGVRETARLFALVHTAVERGTAWGALQRLGLRKGDRVATLMWNHYAHLEAYFAVPCAGGVLHTLNLRLFPDQLAYVVVVNLAARVDKAAQDTIGYGVGYTAYSYAFLIFILIVVLAPFLFVGWVIYSVVRAVAGGMGSMVTGPSVPVPSASDLKYLVRSVGWT